MTTNKVTISGTGCALADFLYNGVSFNSISFKKYLSEKPGDGGLCPGKLVFTEELEKFSGKFYPQILKEITGNRTPDAFNVGGPSLVSLIHVSQMLGTEEFEVKFFGMAGNDETASKIVKIVGKTSLNIDNYHTSARRSSPFTDVFSDPEYDNGHGERTFVNNIGAAWEYTPDLLNSNFFDSHIVCFGGTALVPHIHDNLTDLLGKSKKNKCITVVNTVFDFRNEKNNPGKPWPLGKSNESFGLIDLLIMDHEEALRISGTKTIERAIDFFDSLKVSSFVITNGANELYTCSHEGIFARSTVNKMPVSRRVTELIRSHPELKGDTTGCGDNFAGGIIASIAWQLRSGLKKQFDLREAVSWGIASGGFCCFTVGGTYIEKSPGEKRLEVQALQKEYMKQIGF
jgi:sugar/nucleoside kinase (ribokinase family)